MGDHGTQRILENAALSSCADPVVFKGQAGVTMDEVQFGDCAGCLATNAADRITIQGPLDLVDGVSCVGDCHFITIDGVNGGAFAMDDLGNPAGGPSDITVKNSDWGPCWSSGANAANHCVLFYGLGARQIEIIGVPDNKWINNTIHDMDQVQPTDHYECVRGAGAANALWRGNKFWNCEIYDLNVGPLFGPNAVIENNWFGRSAPFGNTLSLAGNAPQIVRNNSFQDGAGIAADSGGVAATITGNIFGQKYCLPGALFRYNIFDDGQVGCGPTDGTFSGKAPYVSNTNDASLDYHLTGPSLADGFVSSGYASDDIDGEARSSPCDAGSDER
jgi:hypothetical protein